MRRDKRVEEIELPKLDPEIVTYVIDQPEGIPVELPNVPYEPAVPLPSEEPKKKVNNEFTFS